MEKNYTCACCGGSFETDWTEEEAVEEATKIFGKPPSEWKVPAVKICDDCFKAIDPNKNLALVNIVKKLL